MCCLHKYLTKILFSQAHANTQFPLISGEREGLLGLESFSFIQHVCGKEGKSIIMSILQMRNHAE